jgi:DNA adenine methylase
VKWAGGKTRLVPEILARFPDRFGRYHEPFVGGGAVFFALTPRSAVLSDVNDELIEAYRALRDAPMEVISALRRHRATEAHFYRVRAQDRAALLPAAAAARTLYLNRTCFNGLYRVNRRGVFNVPFGRYDSPTLCDPMNLELVSRALAGVELRAEDALTIADRVSRGDLVYFDPPYVPVSRTASFTSYAAGGFGPAEQERLADLFTELAARGVHVVLSNSDTPLVRQLYRGHRIAPVYARRSINSRGDRRGPVRELLITAR